MFDTVKAFEESQARYAKLLQDKRLAPPPNSLDETLRRQREVRDVLTPLMDELNKLIDVGAISIGPWSSHEIPGNDPRKGHRPIKARHPGGHRVICYLSYEMGSEGVSSVQICSPATMDAIIDAPVTSATELQGAMWERMLPHVIKWASGELSPGTLIE